MASSEQAGQAGLADALQRTAAAISAADGLLINAGAGMGVDSGLPDFRGNEGFWKSYPALANAGLDFMEVASPDTFRRDPRLAWGFYGHRLALYRSTVPHAGFEILQGWANTMAHGAGVFTSNVDGQFRKAGFDLERIYECHGSIHHLQCARPCGDQVWPADALQPHIDEEACRWLGEMPSCPRCGGLARPNILMFGDALWIHGRSHRQASRLEEWLEKVQRPVVIELGAGTHVPSVRYFSQTVASDRRVPLVRINPREPEVAGERNISLAMGALASLEAIRDHLGR